MKKTYQIRYNTHSKDDSTSWRLISDDGEILVNDIYVTSKTYTTKDFVDELGLYKYHMSCTGHLKIKDNVAYITTSEEKYAMKRHLAKTITYRLLATTTTIVTAYSLGVNLEVSALLGIGEIMIKPVLYFLHERFWYKMRFTKK
jgi:uncharacterized membrane protein